MVGQIAVRVDGDLIIGIVKGDLGSVRDINRDCGCSGRSPGGSQHNRTGPCTDCLVEGEYDVVTGIRNGGSMGRREGGDGRAPNLRRKQRQQEQRPPNCHL